MLSETDERRIASWQETLSCAAAITCHLSKHERSHAFKSFCEAFSKLAPAVSVTYEKADDEDALPGIEVTDRLMYHAVPHGPELAPFLDVLTVAGSAPPQLPEEVVLPLEQLHAPSLLTLFISPECPFCPKSVRDLTPLPLASPWVDLKVIDGMLFPELAQASDIQSTPTLMYDGRVRWTGHVPVEEILEVVLHQDPSLLSVGAMEGLLGEGKAGFLAQMMMEEGRLFPALFELLTHDKWPVRLGAMVTMEEIIEHDANLALGAVPPLLERFSALNETIQGDVIYIIGQAGTRDTLPWLEKVLSGPCAEDVREAAKEAVDAIVAKGNTTK